jgi:serine/threonine protein phosphatase PrpC
MRRQLQIALGQCSEKGRKPANQDFHGAYIPQEPQLSSKGVAIALADGVSSSDVSQVASEAAVKGFLEDYFCTSAAWSVKASAQRVLMAVNSWLHAQTRQSPYRYHKHRGYVCTFTALVIKSRTAHVFHVGDGRTYCLRDGALEQLTDDHRVWLSPEKSYLSRALGVGEQVELDYRTMSVAAGDTFVLTTDGVHEFVSPQLISNTIREHAEDLDVAATMLVKEAYERGSDDNLTVQIVRVLQLPDEDAADIQQQVTDLSLPPALAARSALDGYTIVRELHLSSRSHVYLALDEAASADGASVVALKTPSVDLQGDAAYLERFLMEEWIARRIDSAHVVKACEPRRRRNYLYTVTEYIDGQTLAQWMIDNPAPRLETVRGLIEQLAQGVLAFHRQEMLHQDLRPENVMIDRTGTVKIVDFGSTRVAGIAEISAASERSEILGSVQYTAPEYFLGAAGTARSDLFSLGVIAYQMLSGKLPYGDEVPRCRTRAAQKKLQYRSVLDDQREIPAWVDDALRKATHPDPEKRYAELSEFLFDLRHPSAAYLSQHRPPLAERHPLAFWKAICLILIIVIALLLVAQ